jgi:hypothetical protein
MSAIFETRLPPPENRVCRIVLRHEDAGGCFVSGFPGQRFANLDEAIDCTRGAPDADRTTIEIWQGGEYVCCFTPPFNPDWRPGAKTHGFGVTAERWANRVVQALLRPASALLWLALIAFLASVGAGWI